MKLVLSWMRDFTAVPPDVGSDVIASRLAQCGFEVAEIVERPEPVIDFEITANRPDCLSVIGLAREASVAFGVGFSGSQRSQRSRSSGSAESADSAVNVTLDAPDLCPRYAAQVVRVKIGPSPEWLANRLLAAGVRPVNNIVDVTNYVMLERGHPMHAFDLDRLSGRRIVVRRARKGEKLVTLDAVERALDPEMLVIADADRAIAVAGVMGGADTEVSAHTTTVALESAWFLPRSVRITSRRLGLKSEASARFERGADLEAPLHALARAVELIAQIGAGQPAGPPVDAYPSPAEQPVVKLRASRLERVLGAAVPGADVERILHGLGFGLNASNGTDGGASWSVSVPSWRVDVQREVDLIEEVGRHYGYDRLPTTFPPLEQLQEPPDPRVPRDELARRVMTAAGFDEAVTFTFIERKAAAPFVAEDAIVSIANPLSEKFTVLRPSLLPGLLDAVAHNRRHGRADVRLFESGACFTTNEGEQRRVALAWIGRAEEEHWGGSPRLVDFFDVRGVAEQLCAGFRLEPSFKAAVVPGLVPGRSATIADASGAPLGIAGQLQPAVADARDMPGRGEVYVAELDLDALGRAAPPRTGIDPLPRFPSVVRDLSILVPGGLPAGDVRGTIRSAAPATLTEVREFDRYQGKGIPEGRVSLSFHLTFRAPDRTLTDAEVDGAMDLIVAALAQQHGATRR